MPVKGPKDGRLAAANGKPGSASLPAVTAGSGLDAVKFE